MPVFASGDQEPRQPDVPYTSVSGISSKSIDILCEIYIVYQGV